MSVTNIKKAIQKRIKKYECKIYAVTLAKKVPVQKNKVYVDNFIGKGYGGNPQYIVEEILRRKLDWDVVWAVTDMNSPVPRRVRKVEYGTLACAREQASAEIWIDNVRNAHIVRKKQGQIYLQTWHGAFGFKGVEGVVEEELSPQYVKAAKYDGNITDAIIAENQYKRNQYLNYFWLSKDTKILDVGMLEPEYNMSQKALVEEKKRLRKKYEKYGISKEDYVILYAPTFRNCDDIDVYDIDFSRVLNSLEKRLGKECKLIVRFHPNVNTEKVQGVIDTGDNRIIDGKNFPIEMERYIISDMLITDYSSVMYSFSLLHKPVFIFAKDYEAYRKERSLLLRPEDTPYPFAKNIEEFEKCVEEYKEDEYLENVDRFYENMEVYKSDNPAGTVVDWIISAIEEDRGKVYAN